MNAAHIATNSARQTSLGCAELRQGRLCGVTAREPSVRVRCGGFRPRALRPSTNVSEICIQVSNSIRSVDLAIEEALAAHSSFGEQRGWL